MLILYSIDKDNLLNKAHTCDLSQEATKGSFETRSKEMTLFFTFLARHASPGL